MKRLITGAFVLFLGACTTLDPYTGTTKTSNTAKGAGIGAAVGAVIGAATASKKDRKKGVLTGAAAGAAAGGGIGYYMDVQEAKLRASLENTGVRVAREGDTLRLIMPGNITFDVNRYDLKSSFHPVLDSVVTVLGEFDKTAIKVAGHTDSTGSFELNQSLSENRARSVGSYLVAQGIQSARVQTNGYGPRQPVASNQSAAGREQNRRVELRLIPTEG